MGFKIFLLGQFKLQADDQRIELPSRPAQSLLAYLALNAGVTHRREKLAALLWPDATENNARGYLRQALWRIRKSLESGSLSGEDFLQISDISITFDDQSDFWLDAASILETAESISINGLTNTLSLYRGELLPGFYDEWVILERERLESAYHQKMNLLLERLIQSERWDQAAEWSEQWIRLGYAPEAAFRSLMQAHAGLGDQGMVTATYKRCVESLKRELSLDPSSETQLVYENILHGQEQEGATTPTRSCDPIGKQPVFLDSEAERPMERPVFVARQGELARLDAQLALVQNGQGRVIFITGEAGSGKTALVQEFTRRSQDNYPGLIVASGNCNAHTGIGDPYLPFRDILELLTGDVKARWAAGAITGEHARILWNTLPFTTQALVEYGADLIDTFVHASTLVERVSAHTSGGSNWLPRLREIIDRKMLATKIRAPQQSDLFEQYTRVLQSLAHKAPIVLVVDDLQWADTGSIGLLFHLGRHLSGSCILIVGAYRTEEVTSGRRGERHPLEPVVNEFQRMFGDIEISLGQAESREFVEAILDSEPNRLGEQFREMLFKQSRGHPLYTIELLRGMQERGDVVQDHGEQWVESTMLDWEALPARVEAVIAERIERLPKPLQTALRVASVEGEEFFAEVVARVVGTDERVMVEHLSSDLDRRHHLIRAQAIERLGSQRVSRYRFRHFLCQKYLYDNLDPVQRAYLHEDVGNAMEELYGDLAQEITAIAGQLAWHFKEASIPEKAIYYLHQAGEKALQLSAYQEGVNLLNQGLTILNTLPESSVRDELELDLRLSLGKAMTSIPGPHWKSTLTRARELCLKLGKTGLLCRVLGDLSVYHYVRSEYHQSREIEEESLSLALQAGDSQMEAISNWILGYVSFALGDFTTARTHLEQTMAFYDPQKHHHSMIVLRGSDSGTSAMAYQACCLWCLGFPEQALKYSQESLRLAEEQGHPFSLADALCYGGCMFNALRRDSQALNIYKKKLVDLALENRFQGWIGSARMYRGQALIMQGQIQEGETQILTGMNHHESIGGRVNFSDQYCFLAQGQAKTGDFKQAKKTLEQGYNFIEETDERYYEAELYRLKGEVLLMQGDKVEAEASLHKAIIVARRQNAKSWELRAATDLARLWQTEERKDEAHALLAPVYEWFTEGFDTPDLIAARTLLEELSML
jgi:DNA-binding SARP family transcriptional activator/predicted ATPase